ncbi:NAD(P)-dependent methylene tetrahydromethanopterin dehydrogenase [Hyphomicrobium denitrificans 1NES1]|uniref:NAD(P)-dependent methylene tetrahydromethanopterin dehydrogenase n=1 Tax=Hyphomicrobium denitrificans 1NES1 TaxID=670307 RepID=N0BBB6_9HYPH|nr:NAD(P)-dependent methylenetetrahydromethanopterin dehydrogenase [Hyphomicrobium denitrificans]AGK59512.1 NAD(P)-dependent methylene tetrahydromethanopterin dehydrogenase [Hyphomicrobium denitrificans 1NES1]
MAMDDVAQFDEGIADLDVNTEILSLKKSRNQASAKKKKRITATPILHFLSTQSFASPFDVNMAVDAGYKVVVPHTGVRLNDTRALVQDAIFSRPPHYGCRTAMFIGGKDALLALDMLAVAKTSLVPPFQLSVLADPGGSFTTAAAMVACVESVYRKKTSRALEGASVAVFGATGVVGFASAVIAARNGADVKIVSHMGLAALEPLVRAGKERFGVTLKPVLGGRDADKSKIVANADVVLCAAAAGIQVLKAKHFEKSKRTIVVADVNAVPPAGIEGVELFDFGRTIGKRGLLSVGPLAIGDIKYKTQAGLLRRMIRTDQSLMLDFNDAFAVARQFVRKKTR